MAGRRVPDAIEFATCASSIGQVVVAHGSRGIRAVFIGDDDAAMLLALRSRFRLAVLTPDQASCKRVLPEVMGLIEAPWKDYALSVDARGTAFQQQVWHALREIPAGSTASYTDIAQRIGCASAVRAVAQACAANPLAVIVPCHRVVRRDGGLSGYRWGIERKRELLRRESAWSGRIEPA
jgi:AraC family transcriptional regulator of adaptative response/methylated-DNA-[protein]-cysteine methyltransferase